MTFTKFSCLHSIKSVATVSYFLTNHLINHFKADRYILMFVVVKGYSFTINPVHWSSYYINTINTNFDFNFDFYQDFKRHGYTKLWKQREDVK